MTSPLKSVGSFFQHAFSLPGTGSPGPAIPKVPTPIPATLPTSKPTSGQSQQNFFSGAAMAQQQGMGSAPGKTLIGQ